MEIFAFGTRLVFEELPLTAMPEVGNTPNEITPVDVSSSMVRLPIPYNFGGSAAPAITSSTKNSPTNHERRPDPASQDATENGGLSENTHFTLQASPEPPVPGLPDSTTADRNGLFIR